MQYNICGNLGNYIIGQISVSETKLKGDKVFKTTHELLSRSLLVRSRKGNVTWGIANGSNLPCRCGLKEEGSTACCS